VIKSFLNIFLSTVLILSILSPSCDFLFEIESDKLVSIIFNSENEENETNDIEKNDIEEEEDIEESENLFFQSNIDLKLNKTSSSLKNICLSFFYFNSFLEIKLPPPKR
jgi:hypothetical protein